MKLYYKPGSGALTVHLALEMIGEPYEVERMTSDRLKEEEYLKLNPQGLVPCLVDGDVAVSQNVAILQYLDAKFPQAKLFAGTEPEEKITAWRLLAMCNTEVHKSFVPIFHRGIYSDDEEVNKGIKEVTAKKIANYLVLFEEQLEGKEYLAGDISVADFYLFTLLRWARHFKFLPEKHSNLDAFFDRLFNMPMVEKVLRVQGLIKD